MTATITKLSLLLLACCLATHSVLGNHTFKVNSNGFMIFQSTDTQTTPADGSGSRGQTDPTDQGGSTEPTDPAQPTEPTDPEPTEPTDPEPTEPTDP